MGCDQMSMTLAKRWGFQIQDQSHGLAYIGRAKDTVQYLRRPSITGEQKEQNDRPWSSSDKRHLQQANKRLYSALILFVDILQ